MNEMPYPINSIIAATDFSANGDLAVLRAAHIAQKHGKTLHLLHVVHPLDIYPELMLTFNSHLKDYERLKQANGLASLDQLAVNIRKDFDIKVRTATRIGRPHAQIAEYARAESADLLVIGYRGEKNVLDAMIGSTAFRVLRAMPCAVLIVRNADVVPYHQVVAAVDFTSGSINVPAIACAVAPSALIETLHVFDLKQETLSRDVGASNADLKKYRDEAMRYIGGELDKLLDNLNDKRVSSHVMNGYLPETICARVNELNADLVVLGKNGKSSLQEFVLGSVSKTVAGMVNCDVLLT
jgi:nucleotide-binding universal stress UspA family protein